MLYFVRFKMTMIYIIENCHELYFNKKRCIYEYVKCILYKELKSINHYFLSFQGVRASTADFCAKRNPCENGGICISVDRGTDCDCRFVPFEGDFCERRKLKMQWHKFQNCFLWISHPFSSNLWFWKVFVMHKIFFTMSASMIS